MVEGTIERPAAAGVCSPFGLSRRLLVLTCLFVISTTSWTRPNLSPLEKYRKLEFQPKAENFGWQERVVLEYEIINAADLKSLRIALKDGDAFIRAIAARALGFRADQGRSPSPSEASRSGKPVASAQPSCSGRP